MTRAISNNRGDESITIKLFHLIGQTIESRNLTELCYELPLQLMPHEIHFECCK